MPGTELEGVYVSVTRDRLKKWILRVGEEPPDPGPWSQRRRSNFLRRFTDGDFHTVRSTRIVLNGGGAYFIAQHDIKSGHWVLVDEGTWTLDEERVTFASNRVVGLGMLERASLHEGPEISFPIDGWHPVLHPRFRRLTAEEPRFDPPIA